MVMLLDEDITEPPLPRWQLGVDARLERLRTVKLIDAAIFAAATLEEPQVVLRLKQLRKAIQD
jgi:hypothetical protein